MKHILSAGFLLFVITSYGQSVGGLVQENGKPLSMVNLSLLKAKDSALAKTAITDDKGYYKIENLQPGSYILKAWRVGYSQEFLNTIDIKAGANHTELPVVMLLPSNGQLGDVTVTGRRPFIEQKIDRMVVNVANTIVASGGNVLEILEKSPGITIDQQNDQILFRGKEGVIIQIDGKPTYLAVADAMVLLRSMRADNVDRIELITNPSAKYDAAGNTGIIDIRLKKNNSIGTNGSFSANLGTGKYDREGISLTLNHRTQKINLYGNYSYGRDGNYWDFDLRRRQPDGPGYNYVNQLSYVQMKNRGHNAKAGIDLFINKKLTAGIVWTGIWNNNHEASPASAFFRKQEDGLVYMQTLTDKTISNTQSNHLFNFNILQLLEGKAQLSADLDLGSFRRRFRNYLITDTIIPGSAGDPVSNLLTQMPTTIDILSFKMDYSIFISSQWKLEAGIKASRVNSDNDMQLSTGSNGNLVLDSLLSNHFKYEENIKAAYLNFNGKLNKKTDIIIGLRTEYTNSIANAISQKNKTVRKYWKFFPSFFIINTMNDKNTLSFSYSYRIDRPNYQSLNPSRSYIDPFAFSEGNPFLKPQFTHSLEFRHGYKSKIFTSIGASFIKDLFFYIVSPIDKNTTSRKAQSMGTAQSYNVTMSFPVTIVKGWTMQNNLMGIYNRIRYIYKGQVIHPAQIAGRITNTNLILLGKNWTGEISGRLNTPAVTATIRLPWLGSLDLGLQKTFKKNWKTRISLQDIFHTNITKGKISLPDFYSTVLIRRDTRVMMLTFSRSFGNQQVKTSRQRKTASEEEIQRANN